MQPSAHATVGTPAGWTVCAADGIPQGFDPLRPAGLVTTEHTLFLADVLVPDFGVGGDVVGQHFDAGLGVEVDHGDAVLV